MDPNFRDNFDSATEQIQPVNTRIIGEIPEWLSGDLIRVGPGKFDMKGGFTCNHWLDGMAMINKFSFKNGKVTFSKRFVDSDAYRKTEKVGRPIFTEFGTQAFPDPSKSFFSRMLASFDSTAVTDNAGVNIMKVGGDVYVSSETCYMRKIELDSLETKEKIDMNKIAGINFASSHVLTDATGTSYNIGMTILSGPKYHVIKTPPHSAKGDAWSGSEVLCSINSSWNTAYSYIHSFAMTDNYVIFMEQPLMINSFKLATSQFKQRSLHDCLEWHPNEMVKFIVINKETGEVERTKYISDVPFFFLHAVNAFEVKGQIVIDIITYPDTSIFDKLFIDKLRCNQFDDDNPSQLMRFVLPLLDNIKSVSTGEELARVPGCTASAKRNQNNQFGDHIRVSGMAIAQPGFDMPTIDTEYRSKPYRYVYGNSAYQPGFYKNAICKVDVETGVTQIWRESDFQYPAEPIFVASPNSTAEDDGLLLFPCADTRKDKKHYLYIIDARNFTEVARVETDEKIPCSLHGIFIPSENN